MGTLGSDFLTERAGVLAIEGLLHCNSHRSGSRIIPDHGGPGHALQQRQVPAGRKEKGRSHHDTAEEAAGIVESVHMRWDISRSPPSQEIPESCLALGLIHG